MTLPTQSATENDLRKLANPRSVPHPISVTVNSPFAPESEQKKGLESIDIKVEDKDEDDDAWKRDPRNPRTWRPSQKWTAAMIVSLYAFFTPLTSSMMAPGLPEVAEKYNISNPTMVSLTLSIFLLSFAFGPLVLAPLSEMYGRTWVLHIANIFTTIFNLGCGFSPNTGSLLAFRFLAGISSSAPVTIGGGSISDVFDESDRASAMAVFSLGPLLGPAIGPIMGGFITQSLGIKWVFIIIAIISGAASVIGVSLLRETYTPVIQRRNGISPSDLEGLHSKGQSVPTESKSKIHFLWINLSRPIILLSQSFICFILSLYMAFTFGIYYLMFTTFGKFFKVTYGFHAGIGGLTYLGLGIGFFLATGVGAKVSNVLYRRLSAKNGGKGTPEMRIPAMFLGSVLVPIGLFWYGWSAEAKLHWIMPIIGSGIFGFGMMTTFFPIQLYLVDAFKYAASATAAASFLRSILGFAFPLFGQQLTTRLGYGGGNSLLAGLAIVLGIPFPIWIYYKGAAMRARSSFTN